MEMNANAKWLSDRVRRRDFSGLDMFQLETSFRLTGSKAVASEIRKRCAALGPYARDERGIPLGFGQ